MTAPASSPSTVRGAGPDDRTVRHAPPTSDALAALVAALPPPAVLVATAAGAGAAGLALSSTGSVVVAAVLFGIATLDRWSALAAVMAVTSVAVRFATTDLGELAGLQSVLGPAGVVGPPLAAASAWCAATAVVLAVGSPHRIDGPVDASDPQVAVPDGRRFWVASRASALLPALAGGALAAALVAGPGPGGALGVRIGATVGAVVLGVALTATDRRPTLSRIRRALAVVVSMVAVVLAAWPA